MKSIPLLDYVGTPLLTIAFVGLFILQWRWPLRPQQFALFRRLIRNLVLCVPSQLVLRWAMLPFPLAIASWAQQRHFGLLNWVTIPKWSIVILTFLLMDYGYWWWHWANHRLPFLWRFHNVHHTDLDMDVSTAIRFHFGEIVFSVGFLCFAVTLFGVHSITLLAFFICLEGATLFHHSNWRLPIGLERLLNLVFVTPRMHGIHHSIVERETNSNWGTIFCWWDQLHRTIRRDIPQHEIAIGVAPYRDENELTVGRLLVLPFQPQRPWKLPSGEKPDRPATNADKLVP